MVCNDGGSAGAPCSRAVEQLCRDLRVQCVTRVTSGGAKAGNLEHARQFVGATGDALIVIFDADQVADSEFLIATVPNFRDSSVAWAQTGQYYRNAGSPISRWANDQQAIFYRVLCPGKAAGNSAFICGTNVAIRADSAKIRDSVILQGVVADGNACTTPSQRRHGGRLHSFEPTPTQLRYAGCWSCCKSRRPGGIHLFRRTNDAAVAQPG